MNVKEVDGVFHCDCGFSWSRGKNGNHNCADGLRKKIQQLVADNEKAMDSLRQADAAVKLAHEKYSAIAAENMSIKAMNDCLSEELRGYESDGAFEGPKMHLLWWQVETPATDRIVAEAEARGVEKFAAEQRGVAECLKKRGGDVVMSSIKFCLESAEEAEVFAQQLREGADK
ncbi:hypothetical protein PGN04_30695 [Klebsiella quasipneumoniae subsp. quasipneumoniae]|uniref:hypothetical protein n=1 Tax=Klebsiella quasipneumoniae TaxID=1463165 RepID=UPI0022F12814|nr:hypothetical protein [Klebsiella quasipneumoniae]MDA5092153.1 hypothetical protein [Klebsiella quasipneumoniae subsp. quasipneumoniae]